MLTNANKYKSPILIIYRYSIELKSYHFFWKVKYDRQYSEFDNSVKSEVNFNMSHQIF